MSSTIEIKNTFEQRSERVKSIDLHPTEPWVLLGMHSGNVCIWNHQSRVTEKKIGIVNSRVRSAKFIARKEWIVVGADDGFIRVYNYNTMDSVIEFKAHSDFIRSLIVHPSQSYLLSASDDKDIKLWDWENGWKCTKTFQGHEHYVMQLALNPRDTNVFASASLDRTIKFWDLGCSDPRSSINVHAEGLNAVNFYEDDGKLYILTGSDDHTTKIWDYESMICVKTLEGHTHNVTSFQCVNLDTSFIITGSEDQTVRVWNAKTYKLDHIFPSQLGRVWSIGFIKDSSEVVLGCDEGILVGQVSSSDC
ncbi:hypothetical protein QVD17_02629 [Tagetes erecta]|uniref:Beta'-coat protein n=1 Tax=Tagetes erecta TaxID=13708 RepID=A0AAD8P2L8_TARER|nr:hypothetical protein QVD17_02629 [Tagetes erecta]